MLVVAWLLVGCGGAKQADLNAAKAQVNVLQTQMDAAGAVKTKEDANRDLVTRYVAQVINAHNPDALDAMVSPDYKRYPSATTTLNLEVAKQRLAGLFAAFPDAHVTIEDMIADGDLVAYRSTTVGTHQGAFLGIPPTGKQGTIAEFIIMRTENGKIAEHWGGPDTFSLLQQIGAVISAAPISPTEDVAVTAVAPVEPVTDIERLTAMEQSIGILIWDGQAAPDEYLCERMQAIEQAKQTLYELDGEQAGLGMLAAQYAAMGACPPESILDAMSKVGQARIEVLRAVGLGE